MPEITCVGCKVVVQTKATRAGNHRLPRGKGGRWKRHPGGGVYCPACWGQLFRLRAVTFPVQGPLEGGTREEMWAALRQCWAETTHLANWAVTELAKADVFRRPGDAKMADAPKVDLYRLWQGHHERVQWSGAAQGANTVLHVAQSRYLRRRKEVVWFQSASLPNYRYGVPFPAHNQAWRAAYHEVIGSDGQVMRVPAVSVAFGGRRWLLQLRGGPALARQLAAYAEIASGRAVPGELSLYRQRSSAGAHRSAGRERVNGGGATVWTRLMCKLVAWLPVRERERRRSGTLEVRSGRRCLFVALAPGDREPWLLHMDHLRRLIYTHARRLQSLFDDTKAERRRPSRRRKKNQAHLDVVCHRQRCRETAEYERASAWLAAYADRRGVSEVCLDTTDRRYCPALAWARLEDLVRRKVEDRGMRFSLSTGPTVEPEENSAAALTDGADEA